MSKKRRMVIVWVIIVAAVLGTVYVSQRTEFFRGKAAGELWPD